MDDNIVDFTSRKRSVGSAIDPDVVFKIAEELSQLLETDRADPNVQEMLDILEKASIKLRELGQAILPQREKALFEHVFDRTIGHIARTRNQLVHIDQVVDKRPD